MKLTKQKTYSDCEKFSAVIRALCYSAVMKWELSKCNTFCFKSS